MSFQMGDIVVTNKGGIGIYKGPSTAKTKEGKVDFFATHCDSYDGQHFCLNHVDEKNLTLATPDHPKYKCIKCIMGIPWSDKPTKKVLEAFKAIHPDVPIKSEDDPDYDEDNISDDDIHYGCDEMNE